MPNQQNIESVDSITSKFQAAAGIYFTDYLGLNVRDITELRRKFTANAVEFRVIKNTLAKLSAEKAGLEDLNSVFDGPTAVALSYDDPTVPARIIKEFNKVHDLPELKAFIFEGKLMDNAAFDSVANLPSREVLLGKLVGGLSSPMSKLASTLKGAMSSFVNVLNNLKDSISD